MKKITVTAKEQWESELRECVKVNGDIDNNPETYKVVDDGIGIINENELYHLCGGDNIDHFFLKVGEKYSHVWSFETPERVLWNNTEKLDFNESWFDKAQVMTFLKESIEDDLIDDSPIPFYQLIWMGVWGSDCECHEYEDYERKVEDEESDPTSETPTPKEEISKVVEDIVQDFRDALTAQKKVVWSMIKNRYIKGGKNIDMERMPEVLGCSDGDGFHIKDCGHFFSIVILGSQVRVMYRPEGDEKYEKHLTDTDFSYEGLLDIFYAMA